MAGLSDLFGKGSVAEQLFVWGVLQGVVSALLTPEMAELQQLSFKILANTPLSPAEAATAANRHFLTQDEAVGEASLSGVSSDRLAILTDLAGDAPAPGDLATALRRKLIPESGTGPDAVSFEQGIAEGNLRDKWTDVMRQLAVQWPTPDDALNALLEGQVSEGDARALYEQFGGDPQFFQLLFDTRGSAPTPVEAATMANRGVIPWDGTGPGVVSFRQAFLEGPWRDKWLAPYRDLARYFPPPRTITAMFKEGSLTEAESLSYLEKQGLEPTLAHAYVAGATHQATAKSKDLTEASVIGLYEAHLITEADAESFLTALRYPAEAAKLLLELADLRRSIAQVSQAVSRVRTLYVGHKITETVAQSILTELAVPAAQIPQIMRTWKLEASVNVRQLTAAQIVDAYAAKVLPQAEAQAELEHIGYTPRDAWILLSVKAKAKLPGEPAPGPNPVGTIP